MNETKIDYITLDQVRPSATNPRKHFDPDYIGELTESIRQKGIKQPLSVRPDWCMGKTDEEIAKVNGNAPAPRFFEIVAGECRYRGAVAAPLASIPVIVRFLSDKETLEDQLIENLQRKDLTPVEEAQGYRRLIDEMGYTVEMIHEKTGKKPKTIYNTLKILNAPKAMLDALEKKTVGTRLCELVGRIPVPGMRDRAADEILHPGLMLETADGGLSATDQPMSFKLAAEHVQTNYMRSLGGAQFDQADESLVAPMIEDSTGERLGGGGCNDCPMKTGNRPELFGDVKRPDVCTNPQCFAAKESALFTRLQASALAEGKKILTTDEVAVVFDPDGSLRFNSPYVKLIKAPDKQEVRSGVTGKLPTWGKLIEKLESKPEILIARDPRGRVVELVERRLAIEAVNLAAKQKGEKSIFEKTSSEGRSTASSSAASSAGNSSNGEEEEPEWKKVDRRNREIAKINFQITLASMSALIGAIDDKGPVKGFWDAMVKASITHAGHDGCWLICKRLGLDPKAENGHTTIEGVQGAALEYGLTLPDEKLKLGYVVELLLSQRVKFSNAGSMGGIHSVESFEEFAQLYKVDLAAVEKKVMAEAKDGKKAAAAKTVSAPAHAGKMRWTRKPEGEFKFNAHGVCENPATLMLPFPKTTKAKVSLFVARYKGGWVADSEVESGVNSAGGGGYPSTSGKLFSTLRDALVQEALRVDFQLITMLAKPPVLKLFRYYMTQIDGMATEEGAGVATSSTVVIPHHWEKITGNKYRCTGCGAAAVKHDGKMLEEKAVRGKPCSQSEVSPKAKPKKAKRGLTPGMRAKLGAAMKARWAARRKTTSRKGGGKK